ncbi:MULTISPECIES: GGDEF domain-containing protein [unclassified Exiguobacterium]|uniref:GGDEF domain-containing protein n=1 Tax=unclassified Exiguobacterium TaxID=2644629 RepID=UPI00103E0063|nr:MULTISPECIES: GGDEF domain-containing protein [unclassified Exiguobacterium]TCI43438.1 GGDEF domain-containing protein [Exiguobacterium sp. SH5S32]TCI52386.1 GGDEF domain-containing protein [Exiguobacterium sp. SH1S4]TCI68693.1 GGDEF domain-containing protein [Exiguobacterium sp. SH1S1]
MGTAYEERRGTLYNYRITFYGNALAWLIHVVFLVTFWRLDVTVLAWSNVFSVLYYTLSFYFVHKRYYRTFFIGLFVEVVYNAIISTIVLGWGANVHYFIIMVAYGVFFMPNVSRLVRVMSTGLAMAIYGFLYLNVTVGTQPLAPMIEQVIGLTCLLSTIALIAGLSFVFENSVVEVTTELERSNERLNVLASRDGLTGLYNRMTGYQRIEQAIAEAVADGRPYAVALADIDHFKAFNERHGHDCGDLVLKQVAAALERTDGICVRWGGEEFLLFMSNQTADEVAQTLDCLRERIKTTETIYDGRRLSVTMTFGVSCRDGLEAVDTLVKEADDRLRAGKQAGKDRIVTSIS